MQAVCSHCGTEHVLKDVDVSVHPKVQFSCSKCGKPTIVEVNRRVDSTMVISPLPSFARSSSGGPTAQPTAEDDGLKLPAATNVVLTVVSGPAKGEVHRLKKPRVVLGRQGADVPLSDPEISRYHCSLEVRETYINLKDLDSTNGTFYEEERVRAAMLTNGAEFRVGESVVRITFEPK
ncbi:MAG TPA: FHA domain-containing protein [Candidatus Acidoferrum sp.]|jgi:hypothetical protein